MKLINNYSTHSLLSRGVSFYGDALSAACFAGHATVAKLLLDRGADIDTQGLGGFYGSPPGAAGYMGQFAVAELLLDRGADVKARGG